MARDSKVVGSGPTDGKGVFSYTWIHLNLCHNYYAVQLKNNPSLMLSSACWIQVIVSNKETSSSNSFPSFFMNIDRAHDGDMNSALRPIWNKVS